MKVKTDSGVSITIIAEGSSRILFFDKPVRAVELKKEETSQISALLVSNLETKTDAALTEGSSNLMKVAEKFRNEGR